MDLNLYLGLPLLPRPPGRLGAAMDCPAPAVGPVPDAPRTDEEPAAGSPAPEEMPSPPVAYSPSDQRIDPMLVDWLDGLSTDSEDSSLDGGDPADAPSQDSNVSASPPPPQAPGSVSPVLEAPTTDEPAGFPAPEEMLALPLLDSPMMDSPSAWAIDNSLLGWLDSPGTDSEEGLDAGEPAVAFDTSSDDTNASPWPPLPLAGLEGVRLEWVERLSNPDHQVAPAAGTEMVSTRQSIGGAIEEAAPELRLQRLIQVSELHRIVRPGTVSRSQRATSPEADRLAQAIQRAHSSLDASRLQNFDSDGKMGGMGAVKKNGNCGCNSSFECNICLDAAKEPVVTPCGHLFCWPCLYKWLHGHLAHSECPVCKGEVLEVNVTPIYGRGGGERDASSNDVPPRPSANRSESLRQQLQTPDPRAIANMVRRLIGNQDHLRGQAAPPTRGAEVPLVPEGGPTRVINRVGVRRQQRPILASPSFNSPSPLTRLVRRNAAPESDNPLQLPSDNAAPAVPQQSSSVEQASTSSTVAVIVGQAAQSRRFRPPTEPTTTRRTRRRQQH